MELDQNIIVLALVINFSDNIRKVQAAYFDNDKRKFEVCSFQDNEHYSVFECLILQVNPGLQDTKFVVLVKYPDIETERMKVKDILDQITSADVTEKQARDFNQYNEGIINIVLDKPIGEYIYEGEIAVQCIQCIIEHFRLHQDKSNSQKFSLNNLNIRNFMQLDLAAITALMIFSMQGKKSTDSNVDSIFALLDKCNTQGGRRCLQRWMRMPLQNVEAILYRQRIVEYLLQNSQFRQYLQDDFLKKVPDLDRLYARFYKIKNEKKSSASLQDCLKIYNLILRIKDFLDKVDRQPKNDILDRVFIEPFTVILIDFEKLQNLIEKSIDLNKASKGDFMINPKFSDTLQQLSKQMVAAMQDIEQVRLKTEQELSISVNLSDSSTHTYVFEAKKQEADEAFRNSGKKYKTISIRQKQMTFTLDDLQEAVAEYNHIKEQYDEASKAVIDKILKIVSDYYPVMENCALIISELDVLASFAFVAHQSNRQYVKPLFNSKHEIDLRDSRHPLLELVDQNCVVNDIKMRREDSRFYMITGPNMGGKSTYIRQIAMSVYLAHLGAFVPCSYASIPIIDSIITRVGAADVQIKGVSTFMSEMLEAACMLKTARQDSLIIIDELGRGTSTSEGYGIAYAIAEYIAKEIKAYCLFATHFHELTLMEGQVAGIKNYHVSCVLEQNKLSMQYKLRPGAIERSYGIQIAQMLKFPKEVIQYAVQKALELETFENNLNLETHLK
ncbi:hypothetical protein pb186bvf_001059 [Paramecium bursaria]